MLTEKQRLGKILENFVASALRQLYPERLGYRIAWSGKDHYHEENEQRHDCDVKLYYEGNLLFAFECKNWRTFLNPYSTDIAQSEVISRFNKTQHAQYRIAVLTEREQFTKKALKEIASWGIRVFETHKLIGGRDFKNRNFHMFKTSLYSFLENLRPKQTTLNERQNFFSSNSDINILSSSSYTTTINKTKDTLVENAIKNLRYAPECDFEKLEQIDNLLADFEFES
jgi:hypothetical protein